MSINRANKYLGEIIEILNEHRKGFRIGPIGDDEALSRLSKSSNEFIDGEMLRCTVDPRYFLSNYYAIRTEDKGFQGLYPFFDSQEILHEELRKLEKLYGRVRAMVLKARRMGYTTYMIGEMLHKTIFWKHTDSIIVSVDEKGTKYNMGMYESAFDFLPWWMKPRVNLHQSGTLYNFDEPDENLRSSRPGLKSWVYADNANRPSGVGRGQGFRRGLLDELAFWRNAEQLTEALIPTFNAEDGFYVMGSTANGRGNPWHNLWNQAESKEIDWNTIFIPFYRRSKTYSLPIQRGSVFTLNQEEQEMRESVKKNEGFTITDETFNWMRKTKKAFEATHGDDLRFLQEYTSNAQESFQSSAITAIPRGVINRYSKRCIEPTYMGEISFDFKAWKPVLHLRRLEVGETAPYPRTENRFHVWEPRKRGEKYCVGVDVSLGQKGGDYSCIQVIKLSSGYQLDEQVACWHGYIDPYTLADIVLAVCWWYAEPEIDVFPLAAIEVNAMGMATFARFYREYEYENVYIYKRMDRLKNFKTDIGGWWTDYKSKRALIAHGSKLMLDDQVIVRDKRLIDEFRDFTEEGADGEGAKDDYAMSFLIGLYCGHEGEFEEKRSRPNLVPKNANQYTVFDRNGVILLQTNSSQDAERFSKKRIGSYIARESGATADLVIKGKVIKVPADFQNTEYSPVHDRTGTRRDMLMSGIPAEQIDNESEAEFEMQQETESANDQESWKWT